MALQDLLDLFGGQRPHGRLPLPAGADSSYPTDITGSGMPSYQPPAISAAGPGSVPGQGPFPPVFAPNQTGGLGASPALGLTIMRDPESVAGYFASMGIKPPGDVDPEDANPHQAGASLGAALNPTPSQQGADEDIPLPRPRPTPSPESVDSTGEPVPAPNTTKSASSQLTPAPKKSDSSNAMDDLGKALAGLHPMQTNPVHVSTPPPPHPSGMIFRSNFPSTLLQQMGNVTKGQTGPYRLGQALAGLRGQ